MLALRLAVYATLCRVAINLYLVPFQDPDDGYISGAKAFASLPVTLLLSGLIIILLVNALVLLWESNKLTKKFKVPNYGVITFFTILFLIPPGLPFIMLIYFLLFRGVR